MKKKTDNIPLTYSLFYFQSHGIYSTLIPFKNFNNQHEILKANCYLQKKSKIEKYIIVFHITSLHLFSNVQFHHYNKYFSF